MRRSRWIAASIGLVAVLAVLFVFDPMTAGFYPRCPSKVLTGYDCPGCGTLRACHAILHGDIVAAWGFNPAVFVGAGLLGLIGFSRLYSVRGVARRLPVRVLRLSEMSARIVGHPAFSIALLVAIIGWTVFRNF